MRYRHKPTEVEAIKYTGLNLPDVQKFIGANYHFHRNGLYIKTLEGPMKVTAGSWVIRGIKGEFYACKSEIFEASYEAIA